MCGCAPQHAEMTDADTAHADALRGRGLQARACSACCTFRISHCRRLRFALRARTQAVDATGTELGNVVLHFASARAGPATVFASQARAAAPRRVRCFVFTLTLLCAAAGDAAVPAVRGRAGRCAAGDASTRLALCHSRLSLLSQQRRCSSAAATPPAPPAWPRPPAAARAPARCAAASPPAPRNPTKARRTLRRTRCERSASQRCASSARRATACLHASLRGTHDARVRFNRSLPL